MPLIYSISLFVRKLPNFFLFSLIILNYSLLCSEYVSLEKAQQTAVNFFCELSEYDKSELSIHSVEMKSNELQNFKSLQIFNFDPAGFVIVSKEDAIKPILAYCAEQCFDAYHLSPSVKWILGTYQLQIDEIIKKNLKPTPETKELWDKLTKNTYHYMKYREVDELIPCNWHQIAPWNEAIPVGNPTTSKAGCAAVAMAQIMKYYESNNQGFGWHEYNPPNFPETTLNVNFGSTNYNWANMPNNPTGDAITADIKQLLYHCGVACDMDYGINGSESSNAQFINILHGMCTFFYFSGDAVWEKREHYAATWIDKLKNNLDNAMPVFYYGNSNVPQTYIGGHYFNIDGYRDIAGSTEFHINWGWAGQNNGYFTLDALNPDVYFYSNNQAAIFNLFPIGWNGNGQFVSGIWNADQDITGEINIKQGSILTINPGVTVTFNDYNKFRIYGQLIAVGTEQDSIIFTAQNQVTGWHGIRFMDTNTNDQNNSQIEYCKIQYSSANEGYYLDLRGGAICCENSSNLIIDHSEISYCKASERGVSYGGLGGGIYCHNGSDPLIQNTILAYNQAHYGGALVARNSRPTLKNVTITQNTAFVFGGGIYSCINASPIIKNTLLFDNTAQETGAAVCIDEADVYMERVHIYDNNAAGYGGGVYVRDGGTATIVNATITGNNATNTRGDGIYCYNNASLNLINSIVWDNDNNDNLNEITFSPNDDPCSIMIAYSDIENGEANITTNGNGTVDWNENNLSIDPLFLTDSNYILHFNSPCNNTGINQYSWENQQLFSYESNEYSGNFPEIGFYESVLEPNGVWEGNVSHNWHNPSNWSNDFLPDNTMDIVIKHSNFFPIISDNDVICNSMNIACDATLRIFDEKLTVTNDMIINGCLELTNDAAVLQVDNIEWNYNSIANILGESSINVYGDWNFNYGANAQIDGGTVHFKGSELSNIVSRVSTSYFHDINLEKTDQDVVLAYASEDSLRIKGDLYVSSGNSFMGISLFPLVLSGDLDVYGDFMMGSDLICNGGIQFLNFNENDLLSDFTICPISRVELIDNIALLGDLTIRSGFLDCNANDISLKGDWINLVGDGGFVETNGTVTFNGINDQYCSSEAFHTFVLNNSSHSLIIENSNEVTCESYNWIAGKLLVNGGIFQTNKISEIGIVGNFELLSDGEIILYQDSGYPVDLLGNLRIYSGNMNIYSDQIICNFGNTNDNSFEMHGGVLDFHNTGVRFNDSYEYSFISELTGGTIRTMGDFIVENYNFIQGNVDIDLYGNQDAIITICNDNSIEQLSINKEPTSKENDSKQNRSNSVTLASNLIINNDLIVDSGILQLNGYEILCYGSVDVNGSLVLDENSYLNLTENSVFINNDGHLSAIGTEEQKAIISTQDSINPLISVENGGTISAEYCNFENLKNYGVVLNEGAIVDAIYSFNYCTFLAATVFGATALSINNDQVLSIDSPTFINSSAIAGVNISKLSEVGSVTVIDATGNISGEEYENDPNNLVYWTHPLIDPDFNVSPISITVEIPAETIETSIIEIENSGFSDLIYSAEVQFPDGRSNILLQEDWNSGDFTANNWSFDPSQGNWFINSTSGNSLPCTEFVYTPRKYDYSFRLMSDFLDGLGYATVTLQYDLFFDNFSATGLEHLSIEVFDGSFWHVVADFANTDGIEWNTFGPYDISEFASGNQFKIGFRVYGSDSYNIDFWQLDNIVLAGIEATNWLKIENENTFSDTLISGLNSEVEVEYNTTDLNDGTYNATIDFTTNDPDEQIFSLPVELNVATPEISVSPLYIDFGTISLGDTSEQSFTIENTGNAMLTGTITTPNGFLASEERKTSRESIMPCRNLLNFSIPKGSFINYSIMFEPDSTGNFDDILLISHNANGQDWEVELFAECVSPEIEVEPIEFSITLPVDSTFIDTLVISNSGTAELEYTAEIVLSSKSRSFDFMEDWSSNNFEANAWSFEPSQGNWNVSSSNGNNAPCTEFGFFAYQTNYNFLLVSKNFDGTTLENITLTYDLFFENYSPTNTEYLSVEIFDGSIWHVVREYVNDEYIPWTTIGPLDISPYAAGNEYTLGFRAHGQESYHINYWRIDNIHIQGIANENWVSLNGGSILSDTIINGNFHNLEVGFNSYGLENGYYNANIQITSNDFDESLILIPIVFTIGTPDILVTPNNLDFGQILIGTNSTQTFTIENIGTSLLSGSIITPEAYTVENNLAKYSKRIKTKNSIQFEIDAGNNESYDLIFSPENEIIHDGVVEIIHNAVCPSETIQVTGEGIYFIPPQNVTISSDGTNLQITWDEVTGANSYKIFASDTPDGTFSEVTDSGTFGRNSSAKQLRECYHFSDRNNETSNKKKSTQRNQRILETWAIPIEGLKKFYYIKASTD